jgi:hypothetical protein
MESKNVLLDVVKVRTVSNHILILEFENGGVRQFDMLPYLDKKPFSRLKDSPLFGKAFIAHGTVVWPGNIDIAPDTLYNHSTPVLAEHAQ